MRKGYTYIDVKPTIPAVAQSTMPMAWQDDLLFDWTEVRIPAGVGRLIGVTILFRGMAGGIYPHPFDVYFSKSDTFPLAGAGVSFTPNTAVDLQPNNDLLGALSVTGGHFANGLNHMEVGNVKTSARVTVPSTQITRNEHRIYVGGVSQFGHHFGTFSFTDAAIDVSGLSAPTFTTLDGTDLTSVFGPGDIVHAYNPVATASVICGEIESMDANNLTFRTDGAIQYSNGGLPLYTAPDGLAAWKIQNGAGAAGDLEDNAHLFNIHPITLKLSFAYTD